MSLWNSWESNKLSNKFQLIDTSFDSEVQTIPDASFQGETGRCWIFAGLNCMRIPFIKKYNLPSDFEFSANYVFFWDKYERCKYFLETYHTIKDKRSQHFFIQRPIIDGGQWHMFVNVIRKYGILPKDSFKETYASMHSKRLNDTLNHVLKYSIVSEEDIDKTMEKVYKILTEYLGKPPNEFKWKNFRESPISFYYNHIKPLYNIENYVSVINDPRNDYDQFYTVPYLTNMKIDNGPMYYNLPMEQLISYSTQCIDEDIPLWFGSDVMKFTSRDHGISGIDMFDDPNQNLMSKKERLQMLDSALTHAMVLRGYKGHKKDPTLWSIENSWGTNSGNYKGYYIADSKWFKTFVYQVVVPKKIAKVAKNPRVKKLAPWDPFGSLAQRRLVIRL